MSTQGNAWDTASNNSDTFRLDVHSSTRKNFEHAMHIAFSSHRCATHYLKDGKAGLVFFWVDPNMPDAYPLPNEMDVDGAIEFAWQWLGSFNRQTIEIYAGKEPDLDGDVELGGFRVYNEAWGHVLGQFAAIVAVQPEYRLLGK